MFLLICFLFCLVPLLIKSQYNWNNNYSGGSNYGGNNNYGGNGEFSSPYHAYNPYYYQQSGAYSPYGQNYNNYYYGQGNGGWAQASGANAAAEEEPHPAEVYTKQMEKYKNVMTAGKRGPGGVQGMLQGGIEGAIMGGFLGAMGK